MKENTTQLHAAGCNTYSSLQGDMKSYSEFD